MPPRYAYWTILIDQKPTAFRAKDREELLPTFAQLQRKNTDVVMKWFARGRLWDTPEQAQWSDLNMPKPSERRGQEWRPGGEHKDPRARFKKSKGVHKPWKPKSEAKPSEESGHRPLPDAPLPERKRSWTPRPEGERRPWKPKGEWKPRPEGRPAARRPEAKRPWTPRPNGDRKPWKPKGEWKPREGGASGRPEAKRPWTPRPNGERKPWKPKGEWKPRPEGGPSSRPEGKRPWKPRPEGERKAWKPKGEWKPRDDRGPKKPK